VNLCDPSSSTGERDGQDRLADELASGVAGELDVEEEGERDKHVVLIRRLRLLVLDRAYACQWCCFDVCCRPPGAAPLLLLLLWVVVVLLLGLLLRLRRR
jgi:hypothetical protein